MRALITRAEPDASAFADHCRAIGITPLVCPVIRIEIEKAAVDLEGVGALAFTSANGVRAFTANDARRDLPVYAVGPVTAEAAQDAGFSDIRAAGGDVDKLADHIASENVFKPKALLHIAGEDRAGDLVSTLKASGIDARRQTLYRAVAEKTLSTEGVDALKQGGGLWVTFFSPRTARLFLDLVEKAGLTPLLGDCRAACLSEAVADAARAAGWRALEIASERTGQGLLLLLETRREGA